MRIPAGFEQFDVIDVEHLALLDYRLHFIDGWRVYGKIKGVKLFLLNQTLYMVALANN
jgi:hypothetical protein